MDGITSSPGRRIRRPRCQGTVENHRRVALDIRELTRQGVFDQPVETVWQHCAFRWPWLRALRPDTFSLVLQLAAGHTATVSWTWMRRGFFDARIFICPHCRHRVGSLYHLDGQVICRTCARFWYACQRVSANGRRVLRAQRLRLKLDGEKLLPSLNKPYAFPSRPRGMHRRTYERLKRREERATRRLNRWYWRDPDLSVLLGLR